MFTFFSRGHCCSGVGVDLRPACLCFRSLGTEVEYQRLPDPTFKHYVAAAAVLFAFLSAIQFTLIPR